MATHAGQPDPHAGYATDSEVAGAIGLHATDEPHPTDLGDLHDVEVGGAAQGDRLTYRGGVWHPEAPGGGSTIEAATAVFAYVQKSGDQNVTTGSTTGLAWAPTQDPLDLFDDANDRFVLTEGVWQVHCQVGWDAANTRSGRTTVSIMLDGAVFRRSMLTAEPVQQGHEVSCIIIVDQGTTRFVATNVSQNNGAVMKVLSTANSNGQTFFEVALIGLLPPPMRLPDIAIELAPLEAAAPALVDGHVTNIGGTVTGYSWDWGDGSAASTGADVQHTYPTAGTYTVTCTATGPKGTDVATAIVVVT